MPHFLFSLFFTVSLFLSSTTYAQDLKWTLEKTAPKMSDVVCDNYYSSWDNGQRLPTIEELKAHLKKLNVTCDSPYDYLVVSGDKRFDPQTYGQLTRGFNLRKSPDGSCLENVLLIPDSAKPYQGIKYYCVK